MKRLRFRNKKYVKAYRKRRTFPMYSSLAPKQMTKTFTRALAVYWKQGTSDLVFSTIDGMTNYVPFFYLLTTSTAYAKLITTSEETSTNFKKIRPYGIRITYIADQYVKDTVGNYVTNIGFFSMNWNSLNVSANYSTVVADDKMVFYPNGGNPISRYYYVPKSSVAGVSTNFCNQWYDIQTLQGSLGTYSGCCTIDGQYSTGKTPSVDTICGLVIFDFYCDLQTLG